MTTEPIIKDPAAEVAATAQPPEATAPVVEQKPATPPIAPRVADSLEYKGLQRVISRQERLINALTRKLDVLNEDVVSRRREAGGDDNDPVIKKVQQANAETAQLGEEEARAALDEIRDIVQQAGVKADNPKLKRIREVYQGGLVNVAVEMAREAFPPPEPPKVYATEEDVKAEVDRQVQEQLRARMKAPIGAPVSGPTQFTRARIDELARTATDEEWARLQPEIKRAMDAGQIK